MKHHLIEYLKCQIILATASLALPICIAVSVWADARVSGETILFWAGATKIAFILFASLQAVLHTSIIVVVAITPAFKFLDKQKKKGVTNGK